jgi:hypothetical protein
LSGVRGIAVLRISVIEGKTQRQRVLEGKLIAPWSAEFRIAGQRAAKELFGRELVIDLKGLTAIDDDGKTALDELMSRGARFVHCGLFTRRVLKQLARDAREREIRG